MCGGLINPMYADDGTFVHTCDTGVRQGDPLGSLLFSVTIHLVLTAVAEQHPEVTELGCLDDGTLIGTRVDVDAAKAHMTRRVVAMGLRVNPHKCRAHFIDTSTCVEVLFDVNSPGATITEHIYSRAPTER